MLVSEGKISTEDLCQALSIQNNTRQPLGRVFIDHHIITRRQLAFALSRQYMTRVFAACAIFAFSMTQFHATTAQADIVQDV
ncbi:MAG: hypothetical protein ACPGRX_06555, partial [Bdellovibrionales bacterium]